MSKIFKNPSTTDDVPLWDMGNLTVPKNSQLTVDSSDYVHLANSNDVITKLSSGALIYNDGTNDLNLTDAIDHIKGYSQKNTYKNDRLLMADNRIPAGYSLYITGEGDDLTLGKSGAGVELSFDQNNTLKEFQMICHYYAIGGRARWEGCDLDTYLESKLYAPASTSLINQAGDFDKYEVSTGLNVIIPAVPGLGAWDIDLTEKITNTQILKSTPVPALGNNGWFDYDADTNILTVNATQTGGYNLYDFPVDLHYFGRKLWLSSGDNNSEPLETTGLVGKKIYNTWKIRIELKHKNVLTASHKMRAIFLVGSKGNT